VSPTIRAARGRQLRCKGWQQEAALRMLCNNLDPEVAERPQDLVVYGGAGKAARDWPSFYAIVAALERLENDQTLLVQSGKPVGIFPTHEYAPRVLIANSLLVPRWATWEHFWELERLGLMMYGQMTAGSWIYIGSQGILQGTYETFGALAHKRFGGSLKGKIVLTSGLGGMGGAQPLAIVMNEGVALCIDVDDSRIERRLRSGYLDKASGRLEEAVAWAEEARRSGTPTSIGVVGNAAEVYPDLLARGFRPDVVTDQTSAHDPLRGYIPAPLTVDEAADLSPYAGRLVLLRFEYVTDEGANRNGWAIDEVRISAGEERPVRVEIEMNNSAGIFQVDDLLATKLRGTPLEGQVEVIAEVKGESEKRLLSGFRLPEGA